MKYSDRQMEYIRAVDGEAHILAVFIIGELEAENEKLKTKNKWYKEQIDEFEEQEALICPEDIGFVEHIKVLKAENKRLKELCRMALNIFNLHFKNWPQLRDVRERLTEALKGGEK